MAYRAVIFDFYGTLTVSAPPAKRKAALAGVAEAIGAPDEEFRTAWWAAWPERATGVMGDFKSTLITIASRLGLDPSPEAIAAAVAFRNESERDFWHLRDDAIPTLEALRDSGIATGVISDCTDELPGAWPDLEISRHIQAAVFSFTCGIKKPDPKIYALACERLDVSPAHCLYVGDGGSNELPGARAVGMTAVRIQDTDTEQHRFEPVTWDGPHITTLADILPLIAQTP